MFQTCIDRLSHTADKGGEGGVCLMTPAKRQRKLTAKQKALVDYLVENGGTQRQAAEAVGYAPGDSARTAASKALAQPHVQEYMHSLVRTHIGTTGLSSALATVTKLTTAAKSEYVRLQAAQDLLDRAGFKPVDRAQLQMVGNVSISIDLGD